MRPVLVRSVAHAARAANGNLGGSITAVLFLTLHNKDEHNLKHRHDGL